MSNKSLIIKSPSAIDADLLKYNVLRVFTTLPANYSSDNGYRGNQKLTIEKIEGDIDTAVRGNGTNIVSGVNNSTTSQKRIVFDISPIDAIIKVGVGMYSLANLKSIMGEGLAALKGLTEITTIAICNDGGGRVSNPSEDTILSGDISVLKTLTNLTYLVLYNTNISGDIAALKALTKLTSIDLYSTKVSGDIGELKTLTNLTELKLDNTNVSGDIAALKTLTNLTNFSLNGTNVSGDIGELKTIKCSWINVAGTNISGDLSLLSPNVLKVSGGSYNRIQKLSWSSSTNRSSKTNIPLVITKGSNLAWDFGDDVDKLLIDEAACTNYSGNPYEKYINVKGNRTSASDNAIQTLQNNGWTVKID